MRGAAGLVATEQQRHHHDNAVPSSPPSPFVLRGQPTLLPACKEPGPVAAQACCGSNKQRQQRHNKTALAGTQPTPGADASLKNVAACQCSHIQHHRALKPAAPPASKHRHLKCSPRSPRGHEAPAQCSAVQCSAGAVQALRKLAKTGGSQLLMRDVRAMRCRV
jgi:hypothetical protein